MYATPDRDIAARTWERPDIYVSSGRQLPSPTMNKALDRPLRQFWSACMAFNWQDLAER